MKTSFLIAVTALCVVPSCRTYVTKQAHVIPIYDNEVLVSAKPVFYGATGYFDDSGTADQPIAWAFEKYADGSIRIIWTIKPNSEEELVLIDSGFHPIPVPKEAVTAFPRSGIKLNASSPTELQIPGANSAFIRENVTLKPYTRN